MDCKIIHNKYSSKCYICTIHDFSAHSETLLDVYILITKNLNYLPFYL